MKSNGNNCEAQSLKGDNLCFFHSENEDVVEKRLESSGLGGKNGSLQYIFTEGDTPIKSMDDVIFLLESTINAVMKGKLPTNRANTIGYLANLMLSAFEKRDLDTKLTMLEKVMVKRS